jgi:chemotaxis protein MotA
MANKNPGPSKTGKPDLATLGGLVLSVGGILAGLLLEGGKIQDVKQATAGMIVLGGTIGAVMITTPLHVLVRAAAKLKAVFFDASQDPGAVIEEIIRYATTARREGLVALERDADAAADPFMRKALNLAVDGADLDKIRDIMELDIRLMEEEGEAESKVYEAAGGYSPTIGIIGAVLGLIQVMKNLANIDEVGHGIAVAFVATVYGVGVANLFFLPAAGKLKARVHSAVQMKELTLEGVLAIAEGMNPKLIRTKLEAYAQQHGGGKRAAEPRKAAAGKTAAAEA